MLGKELFISIGPRIYMDCINLSVKSNWNYKGYIADADSKILLWNLAEYQSDILATLLEKPFLNPKYIQDANFVGFTIGDEFGSGVDGKTSHKYPEKEINNFYGGSSTGAAISIIRRHCDVSLGSDTGGSIASPAVLQHDLMSIKFTIGAVSRFGLIALSQTLDSPGFIGHAFMVEEIVHELSVTRKQNDYSFQPTMNNEITLFDGVFKEIDIVNDDIFGISKKEIIQIYHYVSDSELYSNLARYDNNQPDVLNYWKQKLHHKTLKRILRGRLFILMGLYRTNLNKLRNYRLNFHKKAANDIYCLKITDPIEQEWCLNIANILGIPRVSYCKYIFMSKAGTDVDLVLQVHNYGSLIKSWS